MATFHDNCNVIHGWHGYLYSIVLRRSTTFSETGGTHTLVILLYYYSDKYYVLI
jgi:hypothetical protein